MALRFELVVRYENGTTATATAGQRECAQWERQPFGCSTSQVGDRTPTLFLRYLAYAALWRARNLPTDDKGRSLGFDDWDATVDEVEDTSPSDDEPADPSTPGQPQAV